MAVKARRVPKCTPKQRRFVDEYMVDQCGAKAAVRAGYSQKSAGRLAVQLLEYPHVAAAVAAKQQRLAKKIEVTVDSIAMELEQARGLAMKVKQTSAAVSASMGKAKLFGLIVERHKHSGLVGTYDITKVTDAELDEIEQARARIESILGVAPDTGSDQGGETPAGG